MSQGSLALLTRTKTGSGVASSGVGPNGTIIAAGKNVNLSVRGSEDGEHLRPVTPLGKPVDVGVSIDGTHFYGIGRRGWLAVIPADGGLARIVRIADARATLGTILAGDRLFVVHDPAKGSSRVRDYGIRTGVQTPDVGFSNRPLAHSDCTPDGSKFVVAFRGDGVERYNGATGTFRQSIVDFAQDAAALADSHTEGGSLGYPRSGNELIYLSAATICVVSLPSGSVTSHPFGERYGGGMTKISRDGTLVIDSATGRKIDTAMGRELSFYVLMEGDARSLA